MDIQSIAPAINQKLENMKEGNISNAFMMKDERLGKDYFAVIKLKSKIQPHRANAIEDYQLLQTMLENEKRAEAFNEWIVKKQKETYITINPGWANCQFEFDGWLK
jgi:peptidyl-prolyl cis-trans isomerase SurA